MSPIRAENRSRYPNDWPDISADIKRRAGWRCECHGECGQTHVGRCQLVHGEWTHGRRGQYRVVLTTAHLDHTPENVNHDNLRAMCQPCHLRYDAAHHAATASATRARKLSEAMDPLPGIGGDV